MNIPRFSTGLVIGKFMPPHHGHKLVIATALQQAGHLTLLVCHQDDDPIEATLRSDWLRNLYPSATVAILFVTFPVTDDRAWVRATLDTLAAPPDAVFSSEDYGDRYAELLGSVHVVVDKARRQVPVSASQIRANPKAYRHYLDPIVWRYFAKKQSAQRK